MQLKSGPWKHLLYLAVSCAFVTGGVLIVREHPVIGWLNIVFFGFGVVVFGLSLAPSSNSLCLGADGLTVRSLYRTWHVGWSDVSGFFVARIGGRQMVCWNYSPSYAGEHRGRAISRGLTGVEAGLPETYGRSAVELADLLNALRLQHDGTSTISSLKE